MEFSDGYGPTLHCYEYVYVHWIGNNYQIFQ